MRVIFITLSFFFITNICYAFDNPFNVFPETYHEIKQDLHELKENTINTFKRLMITFCRCFLLWFISKVLIVICERKKDVLILVTRLLYVYFITNFLLGIP